MKKYNNAHYNKPHLLSGNELHTKLHHNYDILSNTNKIFTNISIVKDNKELEQLLNDYIKNLKEMYSLANDKNNIDTFLDLKIKACTIHNNIIDKMSEIKKRNDNENY